MPRVLRVPRVPRVPKVISENDPCWIGGDFFINTSPPAPLHGGEGGNEKINENCLNCDL